MFWETLDFSKVMTKPHKVQLGSYTAKSFFYLFPEWVYEKYGEKYYDHLCVGVDPGVNYGITVITNLGMEVIWGKLPKFSNFIGLESAELARSIGKLYKFTKFDPHVYIEGPAFRTNYGQTKLEQCRSGFIHGFNDYMPETNIKYIAPRSAGKIAFGNGNKSAKDHWFMLNENASDSIGIGLACWFDLIGESF